MGKLANMAAAASTSHGPLQSESVPTGVTGNGADGYTYDDKSQLFLLAVAHFVGEDTFYEDAKGRDRRYVELIRKVAATDPQWTAAFLRWLRHDANMRSASIVGAVEAAKAISDKTGPRFTYVAPRQIMNSVLVRADEPAEALGYWLATHGRKLPKWLKRSLGDAALRCYTPFNVLKWDSERSPVRMADVVEFSQIDKKLPTPEQSRVFKYLLDARHGRGDASGIELISARQQFNDIPAHQRRAVLTSGKISYLLKAAGLTWEAVSGWLGGPMDAAAWEACIPIMRYGALLRNLANFERAGISEIARNQVIATLTSLPQIQSARLLPMAFLNAYNNVPGDTFKSALDTAAGYATTYNIPAFAGRTLILIDTSASMKDAFTTHRGRRNPDAEQLMRWDAAALFGIALSMQCEHADVVSFSAPASSSVWHSYAGITNRTRSGIDDCGTKVFDRRPGENLLAAVARFKRTHFLGGGTQTDLAVATSYRDHDRVIVLTDEQVNDRYGDVFAPVPATVPAYTFNLAGYAVGHDATAVNRHSVGGLSDAGFRLLSTLESTRGGHWPWEHQQS